MMGRQVEQEQLFYRFRLEDHVPADHRLRRVDWLLDLDSLRGDLASLYSPIGRPSINPELLIRMLLVGLSLRHPLRDAPLPGGPPQPRLPLVLPPGAGAALAAPTLLLAGCDRLGAAPSFRKLVLTSGERVSYRIHRAIGGGALAREFDPSQMSPDFRVNGTKAVCL